MTSSYDIEHIVTKPAHRTRQTPILLVHGAWHGAWCWSDCAERFASLGYEVHAISLPGHGDRADPAVSINRYRMADYVDCLAESIAAIRPTPAVVAHSMGGGLLQRYLNDHRVTAAVLLASIPVGGVLNSSLRWLRRQPGPTLRHLLLMDGTALVATPQLVAEAFLAPNSPVDPVALHARLVAESVPVLTAMAVSPGFHAERCGTPVLVAAAELDAVFTVDEQRETAERYGAELIVFENQGHDLMLEPAWPQVVDSIDHFFIEDVGLA